MLKTKKHPFKSWASLISALIILVSATSAIWLIPLFSGSVSHKTFELSEELEKAFSDAFLNGFDTNSGVTILMLSFYDRPSQTQAGVFFDIAVLNHSDENISFPNAAYGLRLFTPNEISSTWSEIKSNFPIGNDERVLEKHAETYGVNTNNSFFMPYEAFPTELPTKIRICVFGEGQITHKKFAACIDVLRQ
jgi:hypothetical protein